MDVLGGRSNFPSMLHPVDYYKFKKNFRPKPAPPRKKPANSFLQLSLAKYNEVFGTTINPPTITLSNSSFTFCDGTWIKRGKNKGKRKSTLQPDFTKVPSEHRRPSLPQPEESVEEYEPTCYTPPPRRRSCTPRHEPTGRTCTLQRPSMWQETQSVLQKSRKVLREQLEKEKMALEENYKCRMAECEREFREREEKMKREYENEKRAQQSHIDALLIKCTDLKGENNLLTVKVSKMMDMLAECAAEVNLQEAELAQADEVVRIALDGGLPCGSWHRLQTRRGIRAVRPEVNSTAMCLDVSIRRLYFCERKARLVVKLVWFANMVSEKRLFTWWWATRMQARVRKRDGATGQGLPAGFITTRARE
ncbi:hypothetical protein RvY_00918 [Ramazzottius varieornatus]|uniref:Uncharacterized protein n=1 Tax=Ramazzottius varieornatus TaxID=947166 RepID=A0A1D1UKK5_RAMVA|nr:hypothetical protein RvY_00918 [Ramazzottius varieornatus]